MRVLMMMLIIRAMMARVMMVAAVNGGPGLAGTHNIQMGKDFTPPDEDVKYAEHAKERKD